MWSIASFHDPDLKLQREDYEKIIKAPVPQNTFLPFAQKYPSCLRYLSLTASMRKRGIPYPSRTDPFEKCFYGVGSPGRGGYGVESTIGAGNVGVSYSAHKVPFIEVIKIFVL